EIIEAVRTIEREKGIDGDTLITALEDALLAAYKKTPGAARHATVELDDEGDFRVYSIEIPADLEERLVEEAREHALEALERDEGPAGHPLAPRPRADQDAVRARGAGDRRRARRDPRRRARAGLPLEDRSGVACPGCRPGRRLRRPARLARADGRIRAPR